MAICINVDKNSTAEKICWEYESFAEMARMIGDWIQAEKDEVHLKVDQEYFKRKKV